MIRLIALTGRAHSGKSTLGSALSSTLGYPTYAFASPIKMTVNALFHWDQRHAEGELKEVVDPAWGFSPRRAYQTFGTDWGRSMLRDDIWLKYAERVLSQSKGLVITDLRFENEAEWVRRQNGLVIHVRRAGEYGIQSDHPSEKGIEPQGLDWLTRPHPSVSSLLSEIPALVSIIKSGVEAT